MRKTLALAAFLVLVSGAAPAADGNAERGLGHAKRWCTSCHIVNGGGGGTDTAPPFQAIANNPANTADGLRAFIADPHGQMPKIHIPRQAIDDILAYLQSLKK